MSRHISKHVKVSVRKRDRDRCQRCNRRSAYMEFDHIHPYSRGGASTHDNVQQLCRKCNIAKSNSLPEYRPLFEIKHLARIIVVFIALLMICVGLMG